MYSSAWEFYFDRLQLGSVSEDQKETQTISLFVCEFYQKEKIFTIAQEHTPAMETK